MQGHHEAEEATLFAEIEKKSPGSMEKNEAQHQSFLAQVCIIYILEFIIFFTFASKRAAYRACKLPQSRKA